MQRGALASLSLTLGSILGAAFAAPAMAQSYGEVSALPRGDCDRACLESAAKSYVAALAAKDPSKAPFSDDIKFTENSVEMPIGKGLWATVSAADPEDGMIASDTLTGNVAWFGHAYEHDKLVFLSFRLHVDKDRKISEAETVIARVTGMPLIHGTGKEPHHPAWTQALTEEQWRQRPRLREFQTRLLAIGKRYQHNRSDWKLEQFRVSG